MRFEGRRPASWRDYQAKSQRKARRKHFLRRLPLLALYSGCGFLILISGFYALYRTSVHVSQAGSRSDPLPESMSKQDLSMLLEDMDAAHLADHFVLEKDGATFTVKSSLDPDLQDYILGLLQRSRTLQAAVVILNPDDGRILSLASYEKNGDMANLCLKAEFPAASLFKIVSAAAALESGGVTPDQTVFFEGSRHTLYKKQLVNRKRRGASKTSFRKAFALSINPVFGKLGIYDLGRSMMSEYAEKFCFNQAIPFDLPVGMSFINVPDDDFGLAEIASGFNKETLISPLHAALLVSAVAHNGIMMAPWLVNRVYDETGKTLYRVRPAELAAPVSKKTAGKVKILMRDTVLSGTCSKSFRMLTRKKTLKDVDLGAKTGTINDKTDELKYDWLAAYALPRTGARGICIAVLSVHGEKLGMRSRELARYIVNYYFTS